MLASDATRVYVSICFLAGITCSCKALKFGLDIFSLIVLSGFHESGGDTCVFFSV